MFNLNFPSDNAETSQLQLGLGEVLFVMGPNGTGKSGLMQKFLQQNRKSSRKISAHRQTWMYTDVLDMTPANKVQTEQNLKNEDISPHSRYRDVYASQRASITIYELIDAENVRARKITEAVDNKNMNRAAEEAETESPIAIINSLFQQSNIPIKITIHENDRLMASKDGGQEYGVAELSDGERNALLIAGDLLTAPEGTLIIIDEPERHLHRSIISPLLSRLFEQRRDCSFVISTHDYNLPLENPHARILLLRSCSFSGEDVQSWDADELETDAEIDDVLKKDLLGSRRKILFVEGADNSLDKSIYSLIFPMASVISKGSCREVE
ncbi:MAG: AAA family ATPase, partial [Candidatus Dadabacteria bacterium]|nr:AAA family ATPase [Candidatus Dadabacteria bacterium]